ncbi:MAG: hypothetical protein KAT70_03145, partial [Thermoplasmata archaeon]|nr:hypothetical protein [Thermoplasmata archaeon]
LPDSLASGYTTAVSLVGLGSASLFIMMARKNYRDYEFRNLSNAFLAFTSLFFMAELLQVMLGSMDFLHLLWLCGYALPIYACWKTVIKYGEYLEIRNFIITTLVVFSIAIALLIPIGIATSNSMLYSSTLKKTIALIYPYLDTLLLLSLLLLAQIYHRGKLELYWTTITVAIMLFTLGDLMNATAIALGTSAFLNFFASFYLLAYLYLAYGFGVLAKQKKKDTLMEPGRLYTVQQLFLINNPGLLMCYAGRQESQIDRDILGGMLTAVQNFIRDSFGGGEENDGESLKRLQYGGLEINIENGKHVFLALIVDGRGTEILHQRMRKTIQHLENRYEHVLKDWDGDLAGTQEITRELEYQFL